MSKHFHILLDVPPMPEGGISDDELLKRFATMLRSRIRYFTGGAVIGGRSFVNKVFQTARDRFTAARQDGARRLKGSAKPAADLLWGVRDLRVRI